MNIKTLIERENYTVVCDTNVYLNIYRYSPDFAEFALECLNKIKDSIILPSTVAIEYKKYFRVEFGSREKRVKNAGIEVKTQALNLRRKVINACNALETLCYPDIIELKIGLEEKFSQVEKYIEDFFNDRNIYDFLSGSWGETDYANNLIDSLINNNRLMPSVSQDDIYRICDEGEKRYKAEPPIPPGHRDAKNKDGVRKYSDLILWKEMLRFAKERKLNIIFITDDSKSDWWDKKNLIPQFSLDLINEFKNETSQKIIAYSSSTFFNELSVAYAIEKTDAVGIALQLTDDDYFERICDDVFDEICDVIVFSGDTYIDPANNIGTEGIDELEIVEHEFISAEQIDRNEEKITYVFTYNVTTEGISFEYWGRDDDTKEILTCPGSFHKFNGDISVEVIREADLFLDYESDNGFESAKIIDGSFAEIEFKSWSEVEYDEEEDYNDYDIEE